MSLRPTDGTLILKYKVQAQLNEWYPTLFPRTRLSELLPSCDCTAAIAYRYHPPRSQYQASSSPADTCIMSAPPDIALKHFAARAAEYEAPNLGALLANLLATCLKLLHLSTPTCLTALTAPASSRRRYYTSSTQPEDLYPGLLAWMTLSLWSRCLVQPLRKSSRPALRRNDDVSRICRYRSERRNGGRCQKKKMEIEAEKAAVKGEKVVQGNMEWQTEELVGVKMIALVGVAKKRG
jgi:hypothetical protein